jgi:hypothetical protein
VNTLSVSSLRVLTLADMTRGHGPLKDHVATLNAFLNDYKIQADIKKQRDKSLKFTNYLISTCWRKMVRRISSWQAMGFIFLLKSITTDQLDRSASTYHDFLADDWDDATLGAGDRTLLKFLATLGEKLKKSLLLASDREEYDSRLNYTEKDFPVMFDPNPSMAGRRLLFSKKNTCEFHKLVVAAFEGFAYIFLRLNQEYDKLVRRHSLEITNTDGSS